MAAMATDHIGGEERVEALAAGRWGRRRWPDPCPRGQIRVPEADSAVVVGGHRRRRSSLASVTPSSWRPAVGDGGRGATAHLLLASARCRALLTAAMHR
ncbi:Os02g0484000 [Oryza sativa Japonica Group]|uniref:Os02g0484000 protein n=1 Tax=Oryza sativa subsp. japonica TaxID=39947 RepID=A0A0P0VJ39_ORYSJ|nr:Os02g0484000 [Oryza sativa Japonica Group]